MAVNEEKTRRRLEAYTVPLALVEFGASEASLLNPLGGLRRDARRERLMLRTTHALSSHSECGLFNGMGSVTHWHWVVVT